MELLFGKKNSQRKTYSIVLVIFVLLMMIGCSSENNQNDKVTEGKKDTTVSKKVSSLFESEKQWQAPDTSLIGKDEAGKLILYGKELITNTAVYLGPQGSVSHLSNGMNCQNCHLNAGRKLYANSFSAVASNYPKWRPRSGALESVEKRINDCLERSLNGKKLDSTSREMKAMVAYIKWVGKDVKKGETPKGASVVNLKFLNRAADTLKGKIAFENNCVVCHGSQGKGKLNPDGIGYQYPPLWGNKSYNVSAGMYRLSRIAGFIKSNMPYLKSVADKPTLSDEEAWDIAAYISSRPRPEKKFKEDYPDFSKKPFDYPYGPFADNFSESQHKYGPFSKIPSAKNK